MMTRITIHRGELLQIKRIITSTKSKNIKKLEGSLHGLYTESNQPVIQIVCGCCKKEVDTYLRDSHGLLTLGDWVVSDSKKAVKPSKDLITLIFDFKGEIVNAYDETNTATLDILQGQSAFREYETLTNTLKNKTSLNCSPIPQEEDNHHLPASGAIRDHINDVACHTVDVACHTQTNQWYNTDRDTLNNTIEFVRRTLADDENVAISRNTSTENMTFKFSHNKHFWVIEFPAEFPSGVVKLEKINNGKSVEDIHTQTKDLASKKNALKEKFVKMCMCDNCTNRAPVTWV